MASFVMPAIFLCVAVIGLTDWSRWKTKEFWVLLMVAVFSLIALIGAGGGE